MRDALDVFVATCLISEADAEAAKSEIRAGQSGFTEDRPRYLRAV